MAVNVGTIEALAQIKDELTPVLKSIDGHLEKTGKSGDKTFKDINARSLLAAAGVASLGAGMSSFVKSGIDFNKTVEDATIKFLSFYPSVEQAKDHVEDLTNFAASTPFQLPGILESSTLLKVFAADTVYGADTLRIIGDAAAGVGAPLEGVSTWVGRLYTNLQAGKPVGEAAARLQEFGLLSGPARNALEELAKGGGNTTEAMELLRSEFEKHEGAMERLSQTTSGLESTFSDTFSMMAGKFAEVTGLSDAYSASLEFFISSMGGAIDVMSGGSTDVEKINEEIDRLSEYMQKAGADTHYAETRIAALRERLVELGADPRSLWMKEQNEELRKWLARTDEVPPSLKKVKTSYKSLSEVVDQTFNTAMERANNRIKESSKGFDELTEGMGELGEAYREVRTISESYQSGLDAAAVAERQIAEGVELRNFHYSSTIPVMERWVDLQDESTEATDRMDLALAQIAGNIGGPLGESLNTFRVAMNATGKDGERSFSNLQAGVLAVGSAMSQSNNIFVSTLGNSLSALAKGDWVGAAVAAAAGFFTWIGNKFSEGQRQVNDWSDSIIKSFDDIDSGALSAAEAFDKAVNWQDNEEGFEQLRKTQSLWEEAGRSAEEATRWTGEYNAAVKAGDAATMQRLLNTREQVAAEAEAARVAEEAWQKVTSSAISGYERAKQAGEQAYTDTLAAAEQYQDAAASGNTDLMDQLIAEHGPWVTSTEAAAEQAKKAQLDKNAEILADEGRKYARIAAFDAAMALGANATAEERKKAAAEAAAAASASWEAAMDAVEASDKAATDAMKGNADSVSTKEGEAANKTQVDWEAAIEAIKTKDEETIAAMKLNAEELAQAQELAAQDSQQAIEDAKGEIESAWSTMTSDMESEIGDVAGSVARAMADAIKAAEDAAKEIQGESIWPDMVEGMKGENEDLAESFEEAMERKEKAAEEAAEAIENELRNAGKAAMSSFDRAKKGGEDAFDDIMGVAEDYQKAVEEGDDEKTQQLIDNHGKWVMSEHSALKVALQAQEDYTKEILEQERQKFIRMKAIDAAFEAAIEGRDVDEAAATAISAATRAWEKGLNIAEKVSSAVGTAMSGGTATMSDGTMTVSGDSITPPPQQNSGNQSPNINIQVVQDQSGRWTAKQTLRALSDMQVVR